MSFNLEFIAEQVVQKAKSKGKTIATAESCTGGMVSAAITSISGSSEVFGYGFVTYSNEAKVTLLGVQNDLIARHGAVSEEVAAAMSYGALIKSGAELALSVTGIAGPNGGTEAKPVGLVYISISSKDANIVKKFIFQGNRDEIRSKTVYEGLSMMLSEI